MTRLWKTTYVLFTMFSISIFFVGCQSYLQGANGLPESSLKSTTQPSTQPVANSAAYNAGAESVKILTTAGAISAYVSQITPVGSPPNSIAAIVAAVTGLALAGFKIGVPLAQRLTGKATLADKVDAIRQVVTGVTDPTTPGSVAVPPVVIIPPKVG